MRGGGYSQRAMLGGWRRAYPYASGLYGRGVLRVPFERIQNHYLMKSLMHYLRVGSGFEVLETDCDGVDRRSCCFIDPDFL